MREGKVSTIWKHVSEEKVVWLMGEEQMGKSNVLSDYFWEEFDPCQFGRQAMVIYLDALKTQIV
jgi:hypothetical protein